MRCRACRRSNCADTRNMSYVVPANGKSLYEHFNDCTQLNATAEDDLPKILCVNCIQNLQQAYNFREEARRSDNELKNALVLVRNEAIFASDSAADLYEVHKDFEAVSPAYMITVSPKRETEFIYELEHVQTSENVEAATYDSLCSSTKNESSGAYGITELPAALEVINDTSIIDPLSPASVHNRQSIPDEEIKVELSNGMFEETSEEQYEELKHKDKLVSTKNYKLHRKRIFHCNLCVYKSTKKSGLKSHVFELHKDAILCHKCSKVFELPDEMDMHRKLVHDIDSDMCCPWCKSSTAMPKDEIAKHLHSKHPTVYTKYFPLKRVLARSEDDPLQCEHCLKLFTSIDELADHIQEHQFNCPICSMRFKKKNAYKAHIKRIHNKSLTGLKADLTRNKDTDMKFNCSICKMQFRLKTNLRKHMYNKHIESVNKAQNDINSKENVSNLQDNINSEDHKGYLDDVTAKETCMKSIYENNEVLQAKQMPTIKDDEKLNTDQSYKKKKFICAYCPREFKRSTYVKLHEQKIHRPETSARSQCPICKKVLDAAYLNLHIQNMHNAERKSVCNICGNSYKNRTQLFSHKLLHLKRKHQCKICNKGFIYASELKVHMRMHTGEEPYACHLCEQRFKIRVRLTYHLQRHAGIKQKCNICDKEFDDIEKLKDHSYEHTGMPYRCPVCDYKGVHRYKFRKHLLFVHEKTLTEDELSEMYKANTGRYARVRIVKDG